MAQKRKILMVAPEVTPLVKVGGLADVVGSLSKALVLRGHDVRIILPRYKGLKHFDESAVALNEPLIVKLGGHDAYGRIWTMELPGSAVFCYLIEHNEFFDVSTVYIGPSGVEGDNDKRFTFLSRAAIDLCYHLDWIPDVIHCHDWSTGLVPVYLNTLEWNNRIGRAASILTLHNLESQGWFDPRVIEYAGLPDSVYRSDCLESLGEVNLLKGGIYNATKITTVSPGYATEIQDQVGGCGLHEILSFRSADLIGVINGIDPSEWNPATDKLIAANFSSRDFSGKMICKYELQEMFGLERNPGIPIFSVVSRLVGQKGLDLLIGICDRLICNMHIQLAVLGTGDPFLEHEIKKLALKYPGKVGAHIGFSNELAHVVIAGADFFIMPSRFEPCGLGQMYAMTYGTLPIVRATGGLADSVDQYIEGSAAGTGFLFDKVSHEALYFTIGWACSTYFDRPHEFEVLRINSMSRDFTWGKSADRYESIYKWAIDMRNPVTKSTVLMPK